MTRALSLLAFPAVVLRRFLDWTTLTYSPSRMAAEDGYAVTWMDRRSRAKRLPVVGRFMRAWSDVAPDGAWPLPRDWYLSSAPATVRARERRRRKRAERERGRMGR